MKKAILVALVTIAVAASGIAGFAGKAKADGYGNTSDTEYSFYNMNSTGHSVSREKKNTSKVYVHPTYGPSLKYNVEGYHKSTGLWMDRSNSFVIGSGIQASITNYVVENNEHEARIGFVRQSYAGVWTRGLWSPDSSRNYTIYK
ncbi:MAG: hypothetical protein IKD91_08440 [Clostridiales bacterium]|nr:hypothetical protein [Clostridiales bacterium]